MRTRVCRTCHERKPLTAFPRGPARLSNRGRICCDCSTVTPEARSAARIRDRAAQRARKREKAEAQARAARARERELERPAAWWPTGVKQCPRCLEMVRVEDAVDRCYCSRCAHERFKERDEARNWKREWCLESIDERLRELAEEFAA